MKTEQQIAMKLHYDHLFIRVFLGVLLMVLIITDPIFAQQNQKKTTISKEQQLRLDLMKSKGVDASLTILPVRLLGGPEGRVSEVIGVILEEQGLKSIELSNTVYDPANRPGLNALADSVGKFVKALTITTDYVLYAEMNGEPQNHQIEELRGIVVDKTGAVVWTDFLDTRDEVFKQVEDPDPMGYSVLLAQRLGPQMGLNDETARNAKPGKMSAIMSERSGLPPESERAALPERQKVLEADFKKSTMIVFSVRIMSEANTKGAGEMIKMINDAGMCKAVPSKDALLLKSSQEGPNEMKKLWDLARDFRDYIQKNPQDADYSLYADYAMPGYVHFVICDRSGEWVIADLQNSTHPDFRNFDISTIEGCNKLVFTRLQRYLKTSVADVVRETIRNSGIEAANEKFKELQANMTGYYLSEDEMNALGYEYLFSKNIKEAVAVFKMNVGAFPESFNTYDSLGEAYIAAGEKELAIRNYEKSLQLNPNSQSGIEALKKLKAK
ncbi:MAG: tetratricopeptide repeat protein [Bacteroidota bacterium]